MSDMGQQWARLMERDFRAFTISWHPYQSIIDLSRRLPETKDIFSILDKHFLLLLKLLVKKRGTDPFLPRSFLPFLDCPSIRTIFLWTMPMLFGCGWTTGPKIQCQDGNRDPPNTKTFF
jgi:hypothetical protein